MENKKTILICSHAMEIGGAERALLGLLNSIDYKEYRVDLFLARHEGELLKFIPESVNLLPSNRAKYLAVPMKSLLLQRQYAMLFGRLKAKFLAMKKVKELNLKSENQVELTYSHKYTVKYIEKINLGVNYDLAISFLTPHYICAEKVKAKKKIAWIHTDYSTIDVDTATEYDMWNRFDHIISISDACTDAFLKNFPDFKNRIIRVDNILTASMIEKQANEEIAPFNNDENSMTLLSIGRFSYAKNFDNVPQICRYILESGIDVKWFLIGYGGEENLIRNKIKEYGVEEHVIILGKKVNPYPYIKACDVYIQPSRYEGKAVTVREAQMLNKPVIITDFPTAKSQVQDGFDGIIVPLENQKCAAGIINVLKNDKLRRTLSENTMKISYSNEKETERLYKLIDS